jgi:glucosamine-phosphate N-acetyltransferase
MKIRTLESNDFDKGFITLLAQLTHKEDEDDGTRSPTTMMEEAKVCKDMFVSRFLELQTSNIHIFVIEDKGKIIASGTLLIEPKFIHRISNVGHIEDVVISKEYRGKKIGKMLVQHLIDTAKTYDCYKVILNCNTKVQGFYESIGFVNHSFGMRIDCK